MGGLVPSSSILPPHPGRCLRLQRPWHHSGLQNSSGQLRLPLPQALQPKSPPRPRTCLATHTLPAPPARANDNPPLVQDPLARPQRAPWVPPPGPSPLTPSPVVAAAARSGPQAPRRSAPGPPPPRTSARPPATAAAEEAAAAVVAAPPPRPPEPPTRTSPNRGRGRFVTQAGPGPDGPPRPLPSPAPPRRAPSSPPRPGAAASRPPLLRWLSQPSNPGPGSGPASCGDPGSGPSRTSRAGPAASFAPCPATTGRHERRAVPHRI